MAAASPPKPWTARQPGKAIWTLGAFTSTLLKLPWWALLYIARSTRQHPRWTYRQAVMNQFMRAFLHHSSVVQIRTPLNLEPGAEQDRFVTFEPSPNRDIYSGAAAPDGEIVPARTGGTWYPERYHTGDEDIVILHLHGGAYAICEGRPADAGFATKMLTRHAAPAKVFMLSYRLSSNPGGRFPAALQDAITAYQALLDQGIPARKIVISGDSAGGNLVIALLRHLAEHRDAFPSPAPAAAALLWSPWTNPAEAVESPQLMARNRHYATDYIPVAFGTWGGNGLVTGSGRSAADPYISPRDHGFLTPVPVWIQLGGVEMLYDDGITFADNMKSVDGNKIEVYVDDVANHDIIFSGNMTGFEKEAAGAVESARRFIDGCA